MRILLISQYFWPEQFTINEVVKLISKKNYIEVLTGKPNYPNGKFFDGYNFFNKTLEKYNKINVFRCPVIPRRNGSTLNLILNYFSFLIFSIFFLFYFSFKKYDLILTYQTTPITVAIPGIILSKIKKIPFIIWVQDLWPDTIKATGHINNNKIYNLTKIISNYIYKSSTVILTQSKGIRNILKKILDKKSIYYLPNITNEDFKIIKNSTFKKKLSLNKNINFMFAGNIGTAQNIDFILKLANRMKDSKQIKFLIVGGGSMLNKLIRIKKKNKLDNLIFFGHKNKYEMRNYFSVADFMILTLKDRKIFNNTVPNKLINYLFLGKPIISFASGEACEIVQNANCGFVLKNKNILEAEKLIKKISKLKLNKKNFFGRNAKKYYQDHFSNKKFEFSINNIFNNLK